MTKLVSQCDHSLVKITYEPNIIVYNIIVIESLQIFSILVSPTGSEE